MIRATSLRPATLLALMFLALTAAAVLSLNLGSTRLSFSHVARALLSRGEWTENLIVLEMRLPRLVLAGVIGASLSVSGVLLQGLSLNELASPSTVGVNAGSGLGIMTALVLAPIAAARQQWVMPLAAITGALLVTALVFALAYRRGSVLPSRLLLVGIAVSYGTSAAMLLLSLRMSFSTHSRVVSRMSGTISGGGWDSIRWMAPCCVVMMAVAFSLARMLNVLHDYSILFWLSAASAAIGCGLTLSYPKYLEAESRRRREEPGKPFDADEYKLIGMIRNPKMWPFLLRSFIYESQVEVVLKLFLQPFLYQGLTAAGLPLTKTGSAVAGRAPGSLLVGVNELFRDSLGAIGANSSGRVERRLPSRSVGLRAIYLLTTAAAVVLAFAAVIPARMLLLGLGAIGTLTFLQNLRRPMFVSQLNEVANKPLRATILSMDSQARSFMVALQLPLMGMAADAWGLWTVAAIAALFLLLGVLSLDHNCS